MKRALQRAGLEIEISSDPPKILTADGIVLPGVGAFGPAANNLIPLKRTLEKALEKEIPLLGSCLGLQLLFNYSEESPGEGLSFIEGYVKGFRKGIKVPHMGWNTIEKVKENDLLEGLDKESYFYFVHSYYAVPDNPDVVLAKTFYDLDFASIISKNNIYGTQFHPEKSGKSGNILLKNYAQLIKR
jgi:glutamine amidotransferase